MSFLESNFIYWCVPSSLIATCVSFTSISLILIWVCQDVLIACSRLSLACLCDLHVLKLVTCLSTSQWRLIDTKQILLGQSINCSWFVIVAE